MKDYNDLMNEYQDVKNEITQESINISNTLIRIKTFQTGIDSLNNSISMIPGLKQNKIFDKIDDDLFSFSKNLQTNFNYCNNEIIFPLNNLIESANSICKMNLDKFNNIKISLIQERQKLNKTKDNYFNYISKNNKQKFNNEDEKILYNAKKENYYQLYKYEVNQMNTIIDENNIKYEEMYNELWRWKEIQKHKIKSYFMKFAKNIEKIGNFFIEHSKNIINDINKEKGFEEINLEKERNKIKNPRFEKVKLEEEIIEKNEIKKTDNNQNIFNDSNFITPMGKNSDNIINDKFFDFDIIEKDELDFDVSKNNKKINKNIKKSSKNNSKNNSSKSINSINDNKINLNNKDGKDNIINNLSEQNTSSGFDEFEIVEKTLKDQEKQQIQNEKLLDSITKKIISEKELSPQEISNLMNLLKEEDYSTKKFYSYTFLTKLIKLNQKYIINLKNEKNFVHLSNILNDISIKESNKIEILKLIIDISQIITYKEWHIFNILRKKNKYLSTKTFWSKIIIDSFINDLNNEANSILGGQNVINENNKNKEKENNVFLLEFIHFSNLIKNYKKLNYNQKIYLDKYARNNIINILTKGIEGMCSFFVQENIVMEVISDFGKNFGFNSEVTNFYKLLLDVYMNRNFIYNLKQISLKEKSTERIAKICLISNISKFLPKNNLINLLTLEKSMTEEIKKNIFRNYLINPKITIEERAKIWGLMLNIKQLKKQYNYEEIKQKILKSIENNEFPKESKTSQNIGIIQLDVNRTFFTNKKESKKHQICIKNVLISLLSASKNIGYYQGMNYIAAFFYQIFDFNEEETFYYMLAVVKNTRFKELFEKDLYLLQINFNVFEKILKIYIPEIYENLNNNQVKPNYYLPPWFLTLFTFVSPIFEKEKVPKFNLLVLESFFLNGWSAIFNAGFTIIKYHRYDIIKIKEDSLMNFMVNTFGQDEIIENKNFETVKKEYLKNSYQINDSLISKLIKIIEYENKNK